MAYYNIEDIKRMFEMQGIKWNGKIFDKNTVKFRTIKDEDLTQKSFLIRIHPRSVSPNDSILTINNFCFTIEGNDLNCNFTNEWCLKLINKHKKEYANELLHYCIERKKEIETIYQERVKKGKKLHYYEVVDYRNCKDLVEKAKNYLNKEKL